MSNLNIAKIKNFDGRHREDKYLELSYNIINQYVNYLKKDYEKYGLDVVNSRGDSRFFGSIEIRKPYSNTRTDSKYGKITTYGSNTIINIKYSINFNNSIKITVFKVSNHPIKELGRLNIVVPSSGYISNYDYRKLNDIVNKGLEDFISNKLNFSERLRRCFSNKQDYINKLNKELSDLKNNLNKVDSIYDNPKTRIQIKEFLNDRISDLTKLINNYNNLDAELGDKISCMASIGGPYKKVTGKVVSLSPLDIEVDGMPFGSITNVNQVIFESIEKLNGGNLNV